MYTTAVTAAHGRRSQLVILMFFFQLYYHVVNSIGAAVVTGCDTVYTSLLHVLLLIRRSSLKQYAASGQNAPRRCTIKYRRGKGK